MVVSIVLIVLGMISMSFFIYGKITNYSIKTNIIKLVTSLLFVALALYLYITKGYPLIGLFILLGGIFGLLGDVALGLKRIFKNKNKQLILLGLFFFAIGHILYDTGLYICYYIPGQIVAIIIPVILAPLCGSFGSMLLEKVCHLHYGKFKYIGMFYYTCVYSLSLVSFSLLAINGFTNTFLWIFFAGALLFASSDTILAKTYFSDNVKKVDQISTTITYYLAQFVIAFSIFFL